MLTEAEKYQKVNEWLLKNVIPELRDIQASVQKIHQLEKSESSSEAFQPFTSEPTNLSEVLVEVLRTEQCVNQICSLYSKNHESRDISLAPLELPELDKIDESLSYLEDAIGEINDHACRAELIPAPSNYSQQTELQKQARFIDKAKRIKQNLIKVETSLVSNNSNRSAPSAHVELLYEPPSWSVPPEERFHFEVRRGELLLTRVDISDCGHYLLGRLPICDIVMNDETCSRQHAVIQFRPADPDESGDVVGPADEIYIYDLGSTSGTYVNGMTLQEKAYYPLYPGDILQFGQFPNAFVLRGGSADAPEGVPADEVPLSPSSPVRSVKEGKNESPEASAADSALLVKERSDSFHDRSTEKEDTEEDRVPPVLVKGDQGSSQDVDKKVDLESSADGGQGLAPVEGSEAGGPRKNLKPIIQIVKPVPKLKPVVSLDPKSPDFDKQSYKRQMIEAYERQYEENLEILRKRKEREQQGLPPIVYVPYVPERPKGKKKWFSRKKSSQSANSP